MRTPRVYVVHPYRPSGGTFMAYHLARILQRDFGLEAIAVGEDSAQNGVFDYDIVFPAICIDAMRRKITDDDLLIANPSFSDYSFGFNCRGRKVMYVQGFNTFRLLDHRFDLYVAVSGFVQNFLSGTYGIQTEVVPPFISADELPPTPDWWERREGSILVSHKQNGGESLNCLRRLLPEIDLSNTTCKMSWRTLMEKIGQARIFLTLSPAEGFGLMPLEAMAMGCTVAGFDGFGGRDYLRPGVNCAVTSYADVEGIADRLTTLLAYPNDAKILADAGRATALAQRYTYSAFREAWRRIFSDFLGEGMHGTLKN